MTHYTSELLPDMGTVNYSLPQHEGWYKLSLSHNTMMMGEQTQLPGGEAVRVIDYFGAPDADLQVMQATVGTEVFPQGGSATRTIAMVRDVYVVDVVSSSGGLSPHDLIYNVQADEVHESELSFSDIPEDLATRWASSAAGHAYLKAPSNLDGSSYGMIQQAITPNAWGAQFSSAGNQTKLNLMVAGGSATTVIAAEGPSNPYTQYHPLLILRREGTSPHKYVCVLEPFETTPLVSSVTTEGNQIEVRYGAETHHITSDQVGRSYTLEVER